jgi:transcriptional regulator with XRE-family HTH domain
MESLGDKIKQLRDKLTQEELAALLQVDRSTLASWEVNRREPDIATLCRIATLFKVSVDWLVGHKPTKEHVPAKADLIHETAIDYQAEHDAWQEVIATAKQYEFDPDTVCQLLELNVKITLALKKAEHKRCTAAQSSEDNQDLP